MFPSSRKDFSGDRKTGSISKVFKLQPSQTRIRRVDRREAMRAYTISRYKPHRGAVQMAAV